MRRICLVLYFCLLPSAWAAPQTLCVATYNVENYLDAATSTRRAKSPASEAKVRDSILALHPDVIALQEIGSSNALMHLDAALKSGGLDLPYWDQVTAYDTNIHLSVLSRYPIMARRQHTNESFLLDGPRRLEVKRGFADLEIQINPHFHVTLIAAHLKSRLTSPTADEEEWRYQEAIVLRRAIDARLADDPDSNLIVLGDFNDLQDSKPLRTIIGRGKTRLFDTRPAERNGATANESAARQITWTHYYAKEDIFSRIDYILLSHAMEKHWTKSETYILASPDWGLASDHRPLVAGFTIPDN